MSRNNFPFSKIPFTGKLSPIAQTNEGSQGYKSINIPLFTKYRNMSNHQPGLKKTSTKHSTSNSPKQKPNSRCPSLAKALLFPKKLVTSQSMLLLNTKYNQFAHRNKHKPSNIDNSHKLNSNSITGSNTNNYIINTLNLSTKNLISNSVEYSDVNDYKAKLKRLQKENTSLKLKAKEREKVIEDLEKRNKALVNEHNDMKNDYRAMRGKYNQVKESEEQLLAILYVIDQSGIGVDEIINRYNCEKSTFNEAKESNRSFELANSVPITLDHSIHPAPLMNVPKLNFEKIKQMAANERSLNEHSEVNNTNANHSGVLDGNMLGRIVTKNKVHKDEMKKKAGPKFNKKK